MYTHERRLYRQGPSVHECILQDVDLTHSLRTSPKTPYGQRCHSSTTPFSLTPQSQQRYLWRTWAPCHAQSPGSMLPELLLCGRLAAGKRTYTWHGSPSPLKAEEVEWPRQRPCSGRRHRRGGRSSGRRGAVKRAGISNEVVIAGRGRRGGAVQGVLCVKCVIAGRRSRYWRSCRQDGPAQLV